MKTVCLDITRATDEEIYAVDTVGWREIYAPLLELNFFVADCLSFDISAFNRGSTFKTIMSAENWQAWLDAYEYVTQG